MTVLFSSPNLTSGGSYTISKGGTVSGGSEFFGLYSGATYSGGTQTATFTASSMVTQVGSTSGGGQPGGGGGGHGLVDGDGKQQFTSKSVLWSILFVIKQVRFYLCFDNQKQ